MCGGAVRHRRAPHRAVRDLHVDLERGERLGRIAVLHDHQVRLCGCACGVMTIEVGRMMSVIVRAVRTIIKYLPTGQESAGWRHVM